MPGKIFFSERLCRRGAAQWTVVKKKKKVTSLHPSWWGAKLLPGLISASPVPPLRPEIVIQLLLGHDVSLALMLGQEHGFSSLSFSLSPSSLTPSLLSHFPFLCCFSSHSWPLLHSNKWVVLIGFFRVSSWSFSLTIKNPLLLEAENRICPKVSWKYSLIGVDIFKPLFKKQRRRRRTKQALGEERGVSWSEFQLE